MKFNYTNGSLDALEDMIGNSFMLLIQKPTLKNLSMLAWAGLDITKPVDEVRAMLDKERSNGVSVTKLLETIITALQEGGFLDKDLPVAQPQQVAEPRNLASQSGSKKR